MPNGPDTPQIGAGTVLAALLIGGLITRDLWFRRKRRFCARYGHTWKGNRCAYCGERTGP